MALRKYMIRYEHNQLNKLMKIWTFSELLLNLEEMFPLYYMHSDVFNRLEQHRTRFLDIVILTAEYLRNISFSSFKNVIHEVDPL